MRAKDRRSSRVLPKKTNRFKCYALVFVLVSVALVALIVPLAVILPRPKYPHSYKSSIIVPLYSYPLNGSWDPLFDVITSHSTLNFTIILNPDSGPGSSDYPGDDFVPQIRKLNAYPNVRTVGYVRTGYATRNITSVLLDIGTYSSWATISNASGLAVNGIFFDEIPSQYSAASAEYLATINASAKNASGLLRDKTVIHNPGTIPDSQFSDIDTDITVVFEDSYDAYQKQAKALTSLPFNRSAYSYIIHSLPTTMSEVNLRRFAYTLSEHTEFFFLTNLDEDYYESFGANWKEFVGVMPK